MVIPIPSTDRRTPWGAAIRLLGAALPLLLGTTAARAWQPPTEAPGEWFVTNAGQVDAAVAFYALGREGGVYLTRSGPVVELLSFRPVAPPVPDGAPVRRRESRVAGVAERFAVAIRFAGTSGPVAVEPLGEPLGRHRFLRGGEAHPHVAPLYREVAFRQVWPGIDVVYRLVPGALEYDVVVAPGADPARARFVHQGGREAKLPGGGTAVQTPVGLLEDAPPTGGSWGRIRWAPTAHSAGSADPSTGRKVAGEPASELVAASQAWGAFVGGERDDAVYAVAADASGRPVAAGSTRSADFPSTPGAYDPDYEASFDIFVLRAAADGSAVEWSTYVGGTGDDRGWALALDAAGNPVVAGVTTGEGFPTTAGAFDETANGAYDAFVLKLSADGSALLWSTLYGGSDREWDVSGLALDPAGRPVVSGSTRSSDLPTSAGAHDATLGGIFDAFVARFAADGSALEVGTYLGGTGIEAAEDVVADATGAVVIGRTTSADFPASPGALQPARAGTAQDGFVARLSPDGSSLVFATYLGGTGIDEPYGVALGDAGAILVGGSTSSADFPTTAGTPAPGPLGGEDAFLCRLSPGGDLLEWSTYYGGSDSDRALGLARDGARGIGVVGWTCSEDLLVPAGAPASIYGGPCDAFLALFADDGSRLDHAGYLGGWRDEAAFAVAVDPSHRYLVGGETWSTNFPASPGSFGPVSGSPNTWEDGFLVVLDVTTLCTLVDLGTGGPRLQIVPAAGGVCPAGAPLAAAIDLIEGRAADASPAGLGPVSRVACNTVESSYGTGSIPEPGEVLFHLARERPSGAYTDGSGPGLSGARTPASGDCPP